MYLWLALHCLGLGAVWLHTVPAADRVREIVGAPEHLYPVALFAVGYPDERALSFAGAPPIVYLSILYPFL
jgi:nitroreductase